jgi:hypothetical protein
LVNGDNTWGKYVSSDSTNDKEVLTSYWYSKTYDKYITDPNTQFLLCLEAYVDKTAKNADLTSYAGEPFLLSALHHKKPLREHQGGGKPVLIKRTLFGLYLICYQQYLSILESF